MREHRKKVLAALLTVALCLPQNMVVFADELVISEVAAGIGNVAEISEEIIQENYDLPTEKVSQEEPVIDVIAEPDIAESTPKADAAENIAADSAADEIIEEADDESTGRVLPAEGVSEYDERYENFYYRRVNYTDGNVGDKVVGVCITGYYGEGTGDLIIPVSINEMPVVEIQNFAFMNDTFDGKLVIPDTVVYIGNQSFYNTKFKGDLIIPDRVRRVGEYAFYNCSGFDNLTIGSGLQFWGQNAFSRCQFSNLIFRHGLQKIGEGAFSGFGNFDGDLVIPESVTSIEKDAFYECTFENIFCPESVGTGRANYRNALYDYSVEDNKVVIISVSSKGDLIMPDELLGMPITEIYGAYTANGGRLKLPQSLICIGDEAFGKYNTYDHNKFTGNLTIPDGVTTIGKDAFKGCSAFIGDLVIPDSVISIGEGAFQGCGGFIGLKLPVSLNSIQNSTFYNCSGLSGNLVIPDSVTTIEPHAFENCRFTGDLAIPNSVTKIGEAAFSGCSGFTGDLTIPDSVISIGAGAFQGCSGLTGDLTIPDSVTTIGASAFEGCNGLTGELTIPCNVTTIGASVFKDCSGLTGTLTLSENVTAIGDSAFEGCSGLTGELKIPGNVISIGESAFEGCGFTGGLTIPSSVETIGSKAFGGNAFDGTLTIPDGTETIWPGVFSGCSGLTGTLTIPNSVKVIGSSAFEGCSGFSGNLIIPDSVESINEKAFAGCSGFDGTLTLPESAWIIESYAFEDCSGLTGDLTIPDGECSKVINDGAFKGCSGFTGLNILCDLSHMGKEVFMNCSRIKNCPVLTGTLNYISDRTFSGCTGLSGNLILSDRLNYIGEDAFKNCSGLTGELVLPKNLIEIGAGAFEGCSGFKMKDLLIQSGTNTIGDRAFAGCTGLSGTFAKMGHPFYSLGKDLFDGCDNMSDLVLITTENNEEFSIVAWPDKSSGGNLKIPATIKGMKLTAIKDGAFNGCNGFTGNLVIPNGVTSIGQSAFGGCSGLDGILTIPDSVTTIGTYAFGGCAGLIGPLTIPDSVTTIETAAFYGCSGLSGNLIIPEGVTTIGDSVFNGTSFSGRLVIPESLTSMGTGAFADCSGFSEIENRSAKQIPASFFLSNENDCLISDNGDRISYGESIGTGRYIKCAGVDGVSLDRESVSLAVGESTELTATVTPANAGNKDVTWIVGDPGIATVSNGVITGVSAGSTIVTVSTNEAGYTASCNVTVTDGSTIPGPGPGPDPEPDPKPVPDPQIKTYTVTFKDGDTVFDTQTVKAGDTASEPAAKPSRKDSIFIGWAYGSSIWNFTTPINKDLVLVADYKAEKVNAKDNSGSGKDKQPVIKEGSLYLVKGQSYTAGGEGWSSDNDSVAEVAANTGKITAKGAGTTTVRNAALSYTVYVAEPQMAQSSKNISVIVGNSAEAEFNLNAVSGTEGSYPVTWYSSNTKVAVVNNGTVTGVAKGSAKITAYVGGKAYTTKVKVTDTFKAPSKFAAKDAEFNMNPLQTFALKFDKEVFSVKGAVWSGDGMRESEDGTGYENKTVRITAAGKITAIGAGTTLITGKDKNGREASVKVTVVPVASKKAVYITKGKSETVKFPKVSNKKAESFSSSDEKVATVDRKGRVKGIGYGTSVISCTYKGFTFTTTVYVEEPEIRFDGVKYESGAEITMKSGEMKQLKIDKTEQTLDYKSSKAAVAFIDENGFVYARKPGKTNISVKINGKKYLIKLEVE